MFPELGILGTHAANKTFPHIQINKLIDKKDINKINK